MVIRQNIIHKTSYALAWLVFCFFVSCAQKSNKNVEDDEEYFQVGSQNDNKELWVVSKHFRNISLDSISRILSIHLEGNPTRVLGNYSKAGPGVMFKPLIPFTRGKKYEVRVLGKLISLTEIETMENSPMAELNIYPSTDTVPENLLKIYLEFSRPMPEGYALDHIMLVRNKRDTLENVFLDLQPALWNKEMTVLTLWLDPGRIKRDLQPNMKIGSPLKSGVHYQWVLNGDWWGSEGNEQRSTTIYDFVAGARDTMIPTTNAWSINKPRPGSKDSLEINFHESLDYMLVKNAIHITNKQGKDIQGTIRAGNGEKTAYFTPQEQWKPGEYFIEVESRLEDLAGNNLNRLFDRDITKKEAVGSQEVYRRSFSIK